MTRRRSRRRSRSGGARRTRLLLALGILSSGCASDANDPVIVDAPAFPSGLTETRSDGDVCIERLCRSEIYAPSERTLRVNQIQSIYDTDGLSLTYWLPPRHVVADGSEAVFSATDGKLYTAAVGPDRVTLRVVLPDGSVKIEPLVTVSLQCQVPDGASGLVLTCDEV